MTREQLITLIRLSLTTPERGAAAVMALNPPMAVRWMVMGFAIAAGVVLAYLLPVLSGYGGAMPAPFVAAAIQVGANILAVVLITVVGRAFGGTGRPEDALLLVAWLQLLMVAAQALQFLVMLLLPAFGGIVMVMAVMLFFWLLAGFITELHGFASRFLVLIAVFATLFATAFVVSFLLILMGVELPGVGDV